MFCLVPPQLDHSAKVQNHVKKEAAKKEIKVSS